MEAIKEDAESSSRRVSEKENFVPRVNALGPGMHRSWAHKMTPVRVTVLLHPRSRRGDRSRPNLSRRRLALIKPGSENIQNRQGERCMVAMGVWTGIGPFDAT